MRTMTCVIVDDEPLAREGMEDYVKQVDFLELKASCKNAVRASEKLRDEPVDMLFLDIHMPVMTGVEFLRELKDPPLVIFTTAHREYAVEGFELEAVDYLLKPISFPRFLRAVNKAYDLMNKRGGNIDHDDHFYVKRDGIFVKLNFEDILLIESVKDYIFIHTRDKRHMVLMSMKAALEKLRDKHFMRVHRSFIINPKHVDAVEGNLLHIGEHKVPVSKQYREDVLNNVIGDKLWKRGD